MASLPGASDADKDRTDLEYKGPWHVSFSSCCLWARVRDKSSCTSRRRTKYYKIRGRGLVHLLRMRTVLVLGSPYATDNDIAAVEALIVAGQSHAQSRQASIVQPTLFPNLESNDPSASVVLTSRRGRPQAAACRIPTAKYKYNRQLCTCNVPHSLPHSPPLPSSVCRGLGEIVSPGLLALGG